MTCSRSLRVIACGLLCSLSLGCRAGEDPAPGDSSHSPPHSPARVVLLVSIDTLRADHLGLYGYERFTSPVLDEVAREGVVFEDASSTASWTLPSHTSMLTGLYPAEHGVTGFATALAASVPTLAGMLAAAGWQTAAVVNVEWLRKETYGVTREFGLYSWAQATLDRRTANSWVTDQAIDWIREADESPIFVFAHYYDVHADYKARRAYEKLFLTPYDGIADGTGWQLKQAALPEEYFAHCRGHEGEPNCSFGDGFVLGPSTHKLVLAEADLRRTRELYDAQIRQLDAELARLFTELRRLDLFDDTLLIVTSDHGEEFMEHGSMEHFYTAYQEVVRVPLIVRGPGVPPGRRVDTPVSLVDLVPTVLAMAGVDGHETHGLDLAPLWGSGDASGFEGRLLYVEAPGGESHNRSIGEFFPVQRAVRKGRYKLLLTSSGEPALYDLERDPRELEDISADEQDLVLELLAAAEERYAEAAGDGPRSAVELDPDALERLRALGYVP